MHNNVHLRTMLTLFPKRIAMQASPKISIVVPVLNEAADLSKSLFALQPLRESGVEIIVVDGGSSDSTLLVAHPFADRTLTASRGRASQMNSGAAQAAGDIFLFLHADTHLPQDACAQIRQAFAHGTCWGRFDVRISGSLPGLALVAWMMNLRSRFTGIATGDQAIFVTREAFACVGGFPDIPLMEDIVISRRLLDIGRPACLVSKVLTSGRRWEKHGLWRTVFAMWCLRLRFFFGASPADLAREYGYVPRDNQ